jgi:hypothetical protein
MNLLTQGYEVGVKIIARRLKACQIVAIFDDNLG